MEESVVVSVFNSLLVISAVSLGYYSIKAEK